MRKIMLILVPILFILVTGCDKDLKCPGGFSLEGTKCVHEVERFVGEVTYSCDEGAELTENNTCVRTIVKEAILSESCQEGLTLDNGYCVGTLKESPVDAYKCNSGNYNSKTGKCDVLTYVSKVSKTCKEENDIPLDNGKCAAAHPGAHSYGEPGEVDPATECCCGDTFKDGWCYSLPNGNYDATLTCPSGSKYTTGDKGKACYTELTTAATLYKKCSTGYTLNDNECTKNVKEKLGKTLTCEVGFTLNNKSCEKVEEEPAKTNINCPEDFEIIDNNCVKRDIIDAE